MVQNKPKKDARCKDEICWIYRFIFTDFNNIKNNDINRYIQARHIISEMLRQSLIRSEIPMLDTMFSDKI